MLHPSSWASFAGVWRFVAAALLFAGLFASSLPNYDDRGEWPVVLTIGIVVALVAAAAAAVRSDRLGRLEIAGAGGLAVVGLALALWWPGDSMDTANKIAQLARQKGLDLIATGVPKTIDNDRVGHGGRGDLYNGAGLGRLRANHLWRNAFPGRRADHARLRRAGRAHQTATRQR